ncbi:hypothetical protein A2U01_0079951, partial [Trifolium medium]|nr:hypothetical protein [Trifolium medium]
MATLLSGGVFCVRSGVSVWLWVFLGVWPWYWRFTFGSGHVLFSFFWSSHRSFVVAVGVLPDSVRPPLRRWV